MTATPFIVFRASMVSVLQYVELSLPSSRCGLMVSVPACKLEVSGSNPSYGKSFLDVNYNLTCIVTCRRMCTLSMSTSDRPT